MSSHLRAQISSRLPTSMHTPARKGSGRKFNAASFSAPMPCLPSKPLRYALCTPFDESQFVAPLRTTSCKLRRSVSSSKPTSTASSASRTLFRPVSPPRRCPLSKACTFSFTPLQSRRHRSSRRTRRRRLPRRSTRMFKT